MTTLELIAVWKRNLHIEHITEATVKALERLELKRIENEANYLPVKQYKISSVQVEPARAQLEQNGMKLDVTRSVGMWAYVGLNQIEVGVLGERHIYGVEVLADALLVIHAPHLLEEEMTDYERIG